MKDKKEVQVGDVITSKNIGEGEVALKVNDIVTTEEGGKKFYVHSEKIAGVHAVLEDDVMDHATAAEYEAMLNDSKSEDEEDEEQGKDIGERPTSENGNQQDHTSEEQGNETDSASPTDLDQSSTQEESSSESKISEPVKAEQPKQHHNHNQKNGNKRRV